MPMMERVRRNTQMQKKTARVRAALSFGSSLEGVSHFACLAASRLFVGPSETFRPSSAALAFCSSMKSASDFSSEEDGKISLQKQLVSYMRTRGVERGGIEVGGKLKLTVNGKSRWRRL